MSEPNPALFWVLAGVFAALAGGTLVRIVALRGAAQDVVRVRMSSLRTWWVIAAAMAIAVFGNREGIALLLVAAGVLSLREFLRLLGTDAVGKFLSAVLFVTVPSYYLLAMFNSSEILRQAGPVVFLVMMGGIRACQGQTDGYIRTTAGTMWGLMLFVYALSHTWFLLELPDSEQPVVGRVGWVLFLVLLTESNDIMQAITGRKFGRTKITPKVSPNKSLEGLAGGLLTTVLLAMVTAPWLTCLTLNRSAGAGLAVSAFAGALISVFGFLGDINMSGIKRDVGVKDGSRLLPGQGGMIDRIDSLTFTAPVFYYFVRFIM